MSESTSWLRRHAAVAAAALIAVSGPLALSGTANADESGPRADVPVTDIDVTSLDKGESTTEPWYSDGILDVRGAPYDLGQSVAHSIRPVTSEVVFVSLTTQDGEDRIVKIDDGEASVVARGTLSGSLAVSKDGSTASWSSWDKTDENGDPVGDTTLVRYDFVEDKVVGEETVEDTIVQPTENWNGTTVFEDEQGGDAYGWAGPGHEPEPLAGLRTISATGGGFAAKVDGSDEPKTTVVDAHGQKMWSTSEYRIEEFSGDGRFAMAVDAESDGLGATSYTVLDTTTGSAEGKVKTDLTTQVTAEAAGDTFVFDASNDGKQALVRFRPNTDAAPKLVTDVADWPNPPEDKPYILSQR